MPKLCFCSKKGACTKSSQSSHVASRPVRLCLNTKFPLHSFLLHPTTTAIPFISLYQIPSIHRLFFLLLFFKYITPFFFSDVIYINLDHCLFFRLFTIYFYSSYCDFPGIFDSCQCTGKDYRPVIMPVFCAYVSTTSVYISAIPVTFYRLFLLIL